jgi:alkaline phosphatase D
MAVLFSLLFFGHPVFSQNLFDEELVKLFDPASKPFYFGVASGDPLPGAVVIWTKIYPDKQEPQEVLWEMAEDTLMQSPVQSGTVLTDVSSAFTVKVDVQNLAPGKTYFYRFRHGSVFSPIGRTKTAPAGEPERLRFAVVSCANYPSGFYNAFGHIARRHDLDAVLHLGDYIYEYGNWHSGRKRMVKRLVRSHIPDREVLTLPDYRTRYGQYRLDEQLAEAHRLHPFIVIWDDHEVANNSYVEGAQNHDPSKEGDWETRKNVARQVYFEWLPIRDNPQRSIVRQFTYGNLAELWMLDGRLEGRSPQARNTNDPAWQASDRYMLGEAQTKWLLEGMANSQARWKVIGNQVIFTPLHDSRVFSRMPGLQMDRWDGYPAERRRIFDFFYQNQVKNIVVLTGDVHTAWAFDLTSDPLDPAKYDRKTGRGAIGAEFVTPSVTSSNFDEVMPTFITWEAKRRFKRNKHNPHLRYLDLVHHGYMTLTLTPGKAQADWFFVKCIDRVDERCKLKGSWVLPCGGGKLMKGK